MRINNRVLVSLLAAATSICSNSAFSAGLSECLGEEQARRFYSDEIGDSTDLRNFGVGPGPYTLNISNANDYEFLREKNKRHELQRYSTEIRYQVDEPRSSDRVSFQFRCKFHVHSTLKGPAIRVTSPKQLTEPRVNSNLLDADDLVFNTIIDGKSATFECGVYTPIADSKRKDWEKGIDWERANNFLKVTDVIHAFNKTGILGTEDDSKKLCIRVREVNNLPREETPTSFQ